MAQSCHSHIQNLARAGIATHVIFDDSLVDPVFAMAKARDMPDVHFAALFENDTLVLGCPHGLPAELAQLAKPILVNDPPTDVPTRPASAHMALRDQPPPIERRRIHKVAAPDLSNGVLEAIQSLTTALSTQAQTQVDALNNLTKSIQARPNGHPDLTEIKYVLQSMQHDMAHLTARARAQDPPDHRAELATFGASLTSALGRLEQMAARMDHHASPPPQPTAPQAAQPGLHAFDLAQADTFDLISGQQGGLRYAPRSDPPPEEAEAPLVFPAYARRRANHPPMV
ncbi:MAG: hypothetical protein AAFP98_03325 [Pseudomonadota bacterium]